MMRLIIIGVILSPFIPFSILLVHGFSSHTQQHKFHQHLSCRHAFYNNHEGYDDDDKTQSLTSSSSLPPLSRRNFVLTSSTALATLVLPSTSHAAAQRAIGSAEADCRASNNCLEKFELDGAIGWTWGGKDRCDATDPRCGPGGQLLEEGADLTRESVPDLGGRVVTHVVTLGFSVGREERRRIRLGLYGNECPKSVEEFVAFMGGNEDEGVVTSSRMVLQELNGLGAVSSPVNLNRSGALNTVYPGERLSFGVLSQSYAYARYRNKSKAGDDFIPQQRPKPISDDPSTRNHDVAGLVSIPQDGIGYGNGAGGPDDEAFGDAFQLTAKGPLPSMDKEKRRVIGQVLDDEGMETLQRLANLPTKKGLKGVIPGQNSGPPLLKVAVIGISVVKKPTEEPAQ